MSVDFLDTNVIVYMVDAAAPRKQAIATVTVAGAVHAGTAIISTQVVQETLNVLTMRLPRRMPPAGAAEFLRRILVPMWKVPLETTLYERALRLQERYRYTFYDSLIIAAALEGGCDRLLSEDLQHGERIEGLVIENPFLA